jgi:hypothetical protein
MDGHNALQHLVVDGSPECVRAVQADMRDRVRALLAAEGSRFHPDAVRVLQRAAVSLDVDSRATPPRGARMAWLRLRHWASVWFSSAGVGTTIPWDTSRAYHSSRPDR